MADSKPPSPSSSKKMKRSICPFVRDPDKDCYLLDMNSNKISMAIYYCGNHYRQCEIFERKMREKDLIKKNSAQSSKTD